MKNYIFILYMLGSICSFSQTLNLDFGTQFIPESTIYKEQGSGILSLMYIGTSYTHHTNVRIGLTFTPHLNILTLQTTVPLFALKRKRNCNVYALVNNRY